MKSIFSALILGHFLLFCPKAISREIILIENMASKSEGELLAKILIKKFNLPKELITLRNTNQECENKSDAIIHLCMLPDGELQIRKMNQYVVKNSLGVFLNQNEGVEK
ncbi:MAG: hypothetical protein WC635_10125 [Bacteriovorax sp.]|jgi:hypothetical protein